MIVADTTIQEYNLIKRMIIVLERYTDLVLTLLALNSSLSFHSPRSSAMNFIQTLPGKEKELTNYYLYTFDIRK